MPETGPRGFRDQSVAAVDYSYDDNGNVTNDANKGVTFTYNVLNKVEKQQVGSSTIRYTYDGAGTVLKRETVTAAGTKTEHYIEGFVYETSSTFTGLRSVPTPEGRAVLAAAGTNKLTYEYHLRDHLGNLRVAFRAEAGTTERKLAWENSEGSFSGFDNVGPSRILGGSYHGAGNPAGSYSAGVSAGMPGPSTRVPCNARSGREGIVVVPDAEWGAERYGPGARPHGIAKCHAASRGAGPAAPNDTGLYRNREKPPGNSRSPA